VRPFLDHGEAYLYTNRTNSGPKGVGRKIFRGGGNEKKDRQIVKKTKGGGGGQAGFRRGRSTVDQVHPSYTRNCGQFFSKKEGRRCVCRPYSNLRYCLASRLTCKLLRILPDRHMVSFIMELVRNRSFTLTIGNGPRSRLRRLRNGVPHGSVLAPLLFNIYAHDLSTTTSRKFTYADDLVIIHSSTKRQALEGPLNQAMATLST